MRASNGQHWLALDHVRALAAFLVFSWHFIHASDGYPVPLQGAPALFPFALIDEGHTGVALFMTLSGYLFAKLLDGRRIAYTRFFWNRFLRLAPMMVVAILAADLETYLTTGQVAVAASFKAVLAGFADVHPLSHGLWSVVVETHFYLALPLLMLVSRDRWWLLVILAVAVAVRIDLVFLTGSAREVVYWTIIGHIDQFLLGIFAFSARDMVRGRHRLAAATATGFALIFWLFDAAGGWHALGNGGWRGLAWALLPTIEGATYALLIAYYDTSFRPRDTGVSRLIGKAGAYSYSIYLLHFFVVFRLARLIDQHLMSLSNFYLACLWSLLCFAALVPIAQLCFRWIEAPFLRLRQPYARPSPTPPLETRTPLPA